jgi:TPR repeat protein
MKTQRITNLALLVVLGAFQPVAVHAVSWWIENQHDAQWTNKPLAEISSEAQGTNAWAKFYFARACFYGSGRARDVQEAFTWLQRAAEQGLPDAQYMLSRFYMSGTGTAADQFSGVKWAERAASAGHADALAILGDAYGSGSGAPFDVAKARDYFQRAFNAGSVWALDWYGHFVMNGENRTARTTNYVLALQCFERAASNGLNHSASHLVDFYRKGLGAPPNDERALFWARRGADQNDLEMMEKLSALYNEGFAEPRNDADSSIELLRRAAGGRASIFEKQGGRYKSRRDLNTLGYDASELCRRYRFGLGTPRDYISFAQWLFVLKRTGEWDAEMRGATSNASKTQPPHIFVRILEGKVPVTSPEDERIRDAVALVNQALQLSDANASRKIGEMYRKGSVLTPESPSLAWLWFNRAADLKDTTAATELRELEAGFSAEQLAKLRDRYLPRAEH